MGDGRKILDDFRDDLRGALQDGVDEAGRGRGPATNSIASLRAASSASSSFARRSVPLRMTPGPSRASALRIPGVEAVAAPARRSC